MATEKITIYTKDFASGKAGKKLLNRSQLNHSIAEDDEELYVIVRGSDELVVPKDLWSLWLSINALTTTGIVTKDLKAFCESNIEFCEKLMKTYENLLNEIGASANGVVDFEPYFHKVADIIKLIDAKSNSVNAVRSVIANTTTNTNKAQNIVVNILFAIHHFMTASMDSYASIGIQIDGLWKQQTGKRKMSFFQYRKVIKMKKIAEKRVQFAGQKLNQAVTEFKSL